MSDLYKLDLQDAVKGLVMAVLASVILFLYTGLTNGTIIDWNEVLRVAIASGLGYIMKNYLTDSQGKLLGKI